MASALILLMGGTGAIGSATVRAIRAVYPDAPLLIGGRDRVKAMEAADRIGHAEGVAIDPRADDLGLGPRSIAAVAVFYADDRLAGLRYAHKRRIAHVSISSGIYEIAPEVAIHMRRPDAAAMVLGYEWLVGATTVATLVCARRYARIDDIRIGALVDDQDQGGPAVAEDFERLGQMMPRAFTRRDGAYIWRSGADAQGTFDAIDGTAMEASGFSSIDVAGLAAATGAPNVQFDIAHGVSSSRRRGDAKSTEIIIELAGTDHRGRALASRHAVFHPGGAAPLTALGVSMILERLVGLDRRSPTPAGLYFPYQILDHDAYLAQLVTEGGCLTTLPDDGVERMTAKTRGEMG